MVKFLFFDYRELETVDGFTRALQRPAKHPDNPLFVANTPWENGNMQLYGSVLKAPNHPFQAWYSVVHPPWQMYLCYAESDDGISWRKPPLDVWQHQGNPTNVVLTRNPHGPAVLYDADDPRPDWRYKMLAGADPSGCISAFRSADGIHWQPVKRHPVLPTNPDCPMGLLRAPDGRYVCYHRLDGFGRRVFRSESWNFVYWSGEPRLVLEPGPADPPQLQFYGMGATAYGPYEIGTLWVYHTEPTDMGAGKALGYQEAELSYARSGYAWHRAAPGEAFLPHGEGQAWDRGNLQAASAPLFLEEEIRYYYAGTTQRHQRHWELQPQTAGLGMASMKPDRFVALCAGEHPAVLLTVPFVLPSTRLFVNAAVDPGGWLLAELLDGEGNPIPGCGGDACVPLRGDSTAHRVVWRPGSAAEERVGRAVRLRVRARQARVYSLYAADPDETPVYWRFRSPLP
ncbi:MAG: hypothetical protein QHJ73_11955 [Armatimonadota bacterium]|nr:hypothetical protein [Armatimonadota bacterium]